MARRLTEPQIDAMIHLLQEAQKSSRLGYNIDIPILAATNYWRRDIQIQEEVEAAEYLCEWLDSLIGNVLGIIRLDLWLKEHHGIDVRTDPYKWKATQVAMYKWMAEELTKEVTHDQLRPMETCNPGLPRGHR